jgi:hypothetical protein
VVTTQVLELLAVVVLIHLALQILVEVLVLMLLVVLLAVQALSSCVTFQHSQSQAQLV